MGNHLVSGITPRKPFLPTLRNIFPPIPRNPFSLYHSLGDDPPLFGWFQPDAPLDHLIPILTHSSAVFEGVNVRASF